MHPALSGVAVRAVHRGGLVDQTLLHDRAVHGEAVGGGLGGVGGGGCGYEGFEDGVLCVGSRLGIMILGRMESCQEIDLARLGVTYDDQRVPIRNFGVLVFCAVLKGGIAGLLLDLMSLVLVGGYGCGL